MRDEVIKAKDDEIQRLVAENKELREKLFELLTPKPKEQKIIKRPMIVDSTTGALREKTEKEATEEFKALQEMGILS